jgi:hypothetical protein
MFVICELAGQCASVRGSQAGTVEIFLDGVSAGKIGGTATERVPGIGAEAALVGDYFAIVSNVWAGPWTEELPKDHPGTQFTLVNGDVVDGVIKGLHERKLDIARDPGPSICGWTRCNASISGARRPRSLPSRGFGLRMVRRSISIGAAMRLRSTQPSGPRQTTAGSAGKGASKGTKR